MKKIIFTAAFFGVAAFTTSLFAQKDKLEVIKEKDKLEVIKEKDKLEVIKEKDKKESQEIIIRKKGDKDSKITVEIKGDNVTINGKPLSEFKDDEITINKRNIIIRDGKGNLRYKVSPGDFEGLNFWNEDADESSAFLGVTTGVYNDGSKESKPRGAEITDISKGSAAEKAGLKTGDVIVKINDKTVTDPGSLSDAVTSFKPKDEVTVYYNRSGKAGSARATLGERKESKSMAYSFSGPDGLTRSFTMPRLKSVPGVDMWNDKEMNEMMPKTWTPGSGNNFEFFGDALPRQQKLGLKIQDTEDGDGVKILDVDNDSPAEKAGLKKDDVVTEIGGKKVGNTDEARMQLHENMEKAAYNIKAKRNGSLMSFDIKIPKKLKTANL